MDELIRLDIKDDEFPVDARELHETLGVRRDFSTWIKGRIEQYGFAKDVDYKIRKPAKSSLPKMGEGVGTVFERIDYSLSLDMGKELAMLENNEKGRMVRKYFILAEKSFRESKAIRLVGKEIRRELTDVLNQTGVNDLMHGHGYTNVTNMIYRTIYGKDARQIRLELGLPKTSNLRDHLSPEEWKQIAQIEGWAVTLFQMGYSYSEVKQMIAERYQRRLAV